MFFATLLAVPVLAGLAVGVWTDRRAVPWALAALSVVLGVAGAVAMAVGSSEERFENVSFGIGAGIVDAALVWIGFALGRISRRSVQSV